MLLHFPGRHLACASSDSDAVVEASELQLGLLERLPSSSLGILSKGKTGQRRLGLKGPLEERTGNQFEDVWRCLETTIFLGFLRYSSTIQWDRSLVIVPAKPTAKTLVIGHPDVPLLGSCRLPHLYCWLHPYYTSSNHVNHVKPRSSSIQVSGVTHTVGNSTSSTNFRDAASAAACWRKVLSNCCQPWSWWPSGPTRCENH